MIGSNIELVKHALDASSLRQEAISSNLANINTDGYKANKVVFESLLQKAANGTAMSKTNDRHFGGSNMRDTLPYIEKKKNSTVKDSGNNVDVEVEMLDQSTNSLYYDGLVSQLNTQYAMLKSVITK